MAARSRSGARAARKIDLVASTLAVTLGHLGGQGPLAYRRMGVGARARTRTVNLGIKSPLLCQIELRGQPRTGR